MLVQPVPTSTSKFVLMGQSKVGIGVSVVVLKDCLENSVMNVGAMHLFER